ncbi:16S rRNA (guanine(966)-N(2))-methyltransferase RsmD [Dermabacteraceae bacterium TAE3-ERU27]|nr:16S rRNA (guanine(966)-N(2))-methyltransferase RsmD [Dermabacteraceae bacterium TAE3-ERU27]
MPRVIAGELKSRVIPAPKTSATRPTSDRVREAVFSRLAGWGVLEDARVLDLYAGSGALGIEALSRGARHATFVESHPATARLIGKTLRDLGVAHKSKVLTAKAQSATARLEGEYDLLLLDPPYPVVSGEISELLAELAKNARVAADATIVVERSRRSDPIVWPAPYSEIDVSHYGETSIYYASTPEADAETDRAETDRTETAQTE